MSDEGPSESESDSLPPTLHRPLPQHPPIHTGASVCAVHTVTRGCLHYAEVLRGGFFTSYVGDEGGGGDNEGNNGDGDDKNEDNINSNGDNTDHSNEDYDQDNRDY